MRASVWSFVLSAGLAAAMPLESQDAQVPFTEPRIPNVKPQASIQKTKLVDVDLYSSECPDYCSGTTNSSDPEIYVCGDPRLGPVQLPQNLPLASMAGSYSEYHRFAGLCPGAFLAKWTSPDGRWVYPPQDGFVLDIYGKPIAGNTTLEVGMHLDRFGSEYGTFMSSAYAPYMERALPPSNLDTPVSAPEYPFNYHVYEVAKPFVALAGPIAPWFGQPGEGVQFKMSMRIMDLIDQGYLTRVNLTSANH